MLNFIALQHKEKPRIAGAIENQTASLPAYVREVAAYALSTGGKRLRPMLAVLCARALGYDGDAIYPLAATLEHFHVATLLHDDILDSADTRRAHPATHLIYGIPRTLLAADAMVSRCFITLAETNIPQYMGCIANAVVGTADGEIAEIELAGSVDGGLERYLEVIKGKTAFLLRGACEIGALCADADQASLQAISDFGLNLGIAFQIADDAIDFAPESVTGKPSGGDVREGKFTPPIAFYLSSLQGREREDFIRHFKNHDFSESELVSIVRAVNDGGYATKAKQLSNEYLDHARNALASLPTAHEHFAKTARSALNEALTYIQDRKA